MAKQFGKYIVLFGLFFVLIEFAACANPPKSSPSPAPETGGDLAASPSPSPVPHAPAVGAPIVGAPSPANGPASSSPPAPPLESPAPGSSPASSPSPSAGDTPVPSPSPSDVSDINHSDINTDADQDEYSSGGISGGKKAGIAVGVIAAACLVGLGALVYKKRQENIRRSQYGYAARREIL